MWKYQKMSSLGFKEKIESKEVRESRETRMFRLLYLLKNESKSFTEILRHFNLPKEIIANDLKILSKNGLLSAKIELGPRGEITRYRSTLLGERILANKRGIEFYIISLDPTVLNTRHRLNSFLKSKLVEEHKLVIPTIINSSIVDLKWDELSSLLGRWEWNASRSRLREWHASADFKRKCKTLVEICVPYNQIMRELSSEEEELLSKVTSALRTESPQVVEIAKEIVRGAVVKKAPHFSYTKHARRWFKELQNVLIMEISDATDTASRAKTRIKLKIEHAGWRGYITVFFFELVADSALATAIPPPIGPMLAGLSAGSFLVGLLANGKKVSTKSS